MSSSLPISKRRPDLMEKDDDASSGDESESVERSKATGDDQNSASKKRKNLYDSSDSSDNEDDSSDDENEDEEENEEENEEDRKFIADDEEEERERKKKKKKKRRREKTESDDDHDALDEEDLDLLQENMGYASTRKTSGSGGFKRLKQKSMQDKEDDLSDEDHRAKDKSKPWEQLFADSSDTEDDGAEKRASKDKAARSSKAVELGDEDELDNFIVDDEEDEDDSGVPNASRLARLKENKQRREFAKSIGQDVGITDDAWHDIQECFGTAEYEWALAISNGAGDEFGDGDQMDLDDEYAGETGTKSKKQFSLKDHYEPDELKAKMLTDTDEKIRIVDVPERYQMLETFSPNPTPSDLASSSHYILSHFPPSATSRDISHNLITRILQLICSELMEVPFIYQHRRDQIDNLSRDDLWRIVDLDVEWEGVKMKQESCLAVCQKVKERVTRLMQDGDGNGETTPGLLSSPTSPMTPTPLNRASFKDTETKALSILENNNAGTPDQINDYLDFIKYYFGSELARLEEVDNVADGETSVQRRQRQSQRRRAVKSVYERVRGGKVWDLMKFLNFDAFEVVQAYIDGFSLRTPLPAQSPSEVASNFTSSERQPVPIVLQTLRALCSTSLFIDPRLRNAIRTKFERDCVIDILPTERGKKEIDESHPHYEFKYTRGKPLQSLGPTDILSIMKASGEIDNSPQLLNYKIGLPQAVKDTIHENLLRTMIDTVYSETGQQWENEYKMIVGECLDTHLLPLLAKQVKENLKVKAQEYVANEAGKILEEKVNVKPYTVKITDEDVERKRKVKGKNKKRGRDDDEDQDEEQPVTVLGISWGSDEMRDATFGVMVDREGDVQDHIRLEKMRGRREDKDEDIKQLKQFLLIHEPDVIAIGGFGASTNNLKNELTNLISELSNSYDDEERNYATKVRVEYVDDETARIYMHSKRSEREFPHLVALQRYCVALARRLQNPLVEYTQLFLPNVARSSGGVVSADGLQCEAMMLKLHPLQDMVPMDLLIRKLERACVNAVSDVGVDINDCITKEHFRGLVSFVPGLGHRKATMLLGKIAKDGGKMKSREELITRRVTGANVFINAASFIRIRRKHFRRRSEKEDIDVLDDTRVHPEDYDLARKMAADALDIEEMEDEDENNKSIHVEEVLRRKDVLDTLLLEDYAEQLQKMSGTPRLKTLEHIKAELISPFEDKRKPYAPPAPMVVLTMLSGETEQSLKPGTLVNAIVKRVNDRGPFCKLSNGLDATIFISGGSGVNPQAQFHIGQMIQAYIDRVEADRMVVILTREQPMSTKPPKGPYWWTSKEDEDLKAQKEVVEKASNDLSKKNITFRLYKDVRDFREAEQYLANNARMVQYIVRPSRKHQRLALTWRVAEGVYQHFDFEHKEDGTVTLGPHEYSSLDEMHSRYMLPMIHHANELLNHPKFVRDSNQIDSVFEDAFRLQPKQGHYRFTFSVIEPKGRFVIMYRAKRDTKTVTELVQVTPSGFLFRQKQCKDVNELIMAFKDRAKSKEYQAQAKQPPPAMPPVLPPHQFPPGFPFPPAGQLPPFPPGGVLPPQVYGNAPPVPPFYPPPPGMSQYNGYNAPPQQTQQQQQPPASTYDYQRERSRDGYDQGSGYDRRDPREYDRDRRDPRDQGRDYNRGYQSGRYNDGGYGSR